MASFLHLGDIHLGYRQYKLIEREKDFFRAFLDLAEKWAIQKKVDFVLIAGDLFNNRTISPQSFNEAVFVLNKLKAANIPVVAIEGNHDFKESGNFSNSKGSWYEALAQGGLMYFLYPTYKDGQLELQPLELNKKFIGGAYLDIPTKTGPVRIFGSRWQGFNAGLLLPEYSQAIRSLTEDKHFKIFMFHAGHENYLPVNRGGVSAADFEAFSETVDYVALGHIHESYTFQNSQGRSFLFNPGSTEANSMAEAGISRGGFYVQVSSEKEIEVQLVKDYHQRPFLKLPNLNPQNFATHDFLVKAALEMAKAELEKYPNESPVVQVNISGIANFDRQASELNELKQQIEDHGALYCQVRWETNDLEYEFVDEAGETVNRSVLERKVLLEIMKSDPSIQEPEVFAEMMLKVKEQMLLQAASPAEVLAQIEAYEEKPELSIVSV